MAVRRLLCCRRSIKSSSIESSASPLAVAPVIWLTVSNTPKPVFLSRLMVPVAMPPPTSRAISRVVAPAPAERRLRTGSLKKSYTPLPSELTNVTGVPRKLTLPSSECSARSSCIV